MSDIKAALRALTTSAPPTLKDRIRDLLPEIEIARGSRTPWKDIIAFLAVRDIKIELQVLANYICQLRRETRPPAPAPIGDLPVKPTPSPQAKRVVEQAGGSNGEPPRQLTGGLRALSPLQ